MCQKSKSAFRPNINPLFRSQMIDQLKEISIFCIFRGVPSPPKVQYYSYLIKVIETKVFVQKSLLQWSKWFELVKLSIKRVQNFQKIFWVQYCFTQGCTADVKHSFTTIAIS